jgi:hypothetical protein
MWDAFISHASEDKETFVAPLAHILKEMGATIWYDEFELKVGDSLSKSIDAGLTKSKYGIIVLSHSFISKGWTDYELRSLISKEVGREKVIIPIWHNITKQEILDFSPYLADKFALISSVDLERLAVKLLEIIRPEIANSHLTMGIFRELQKSAQTKVCNIKDIVESDVIFHQEIPFRVIMMSKIICDLFGDVLNMNYVEFITNLAKDADYEQELKYGVLCLVLIYSMYMSLMLISVTRKRSLKLCIQYLHIPWEHLTQKA